MIDIKRKIIAQINSIDDEQLLNEISELLKRYSEDVYIELTEDQIKEIENSQNQIKNGEFLTHEEVVKLFSNG